MARKRRPSELLAPGEYEKLAEQRGEVCWLCGAGPKSRRLHIDHDHRTGAIRGLLCFRCNNALPAWLDCDWLVRAIDYLDPTHIEHWVRSR